MLKYRATDYSSPEIKEVEVSKETEKSVWVTGIWSKPRREAKESSGVKYFDTWDDAQAWLMNRAQSGIDRLVRRVELAKGRLGNIKGMKKKEESHG